jgi:hypothetical protein
MYNPDFNSPEFGGIRNEAGANRFLLSAKQWIEKTNSIGIMAKAGRYGGTYAHKDILVCLVNLEVLNAHLIKENFSQSQRIAALNKTAIEQMRILTEDYIINRLGNNRP